MVAVTGMMIRNSIKYVVEASWPIIINGCSTG